MNPIHRHLLGGLLQHRGLTVGFLTVHVLLALSELAGFLSVQALLGHMTRAPDNPPPLLIPNLSFGWALLFTVVFQCWLTGGNWFRSNFMSKLKAHLVNDWSSSFYDAFFKARWTAIHRHQPVELAHLSTFEVDRMGQGAFIALRGLSSVALLVLYTFGLVLLFDPKLTVVIVFLLVVWMLLQRLMPETRGSGQALSEKGENLERQAANFFKGFKTLTSLGSWPASQLLRDTEANEEAGREAFMLLVKSRTLQRCINAVVVGLMLFFLVVTLKAPLEHILVLSYIYYRLSPISSGILMDLQEWRQTRPAFERYLQVLDRFRSLPQPWTGKAAIRKPFGVSLMGVNFSYPNQDEVVFKNLNLNFPAGKITVVRGSNGAGKSTLFGLLLGIIVPDDGVVEIGGFPLHLHRREDWEREVSTLPQDPFILKGTLEENLNLGRGDVSQLRKGQHDLSSWVREFPEGLSSHLDESGAQWSGGQMKKAALLRTFIQPASFTLLDEPTEHLDDSGRNLLMATVSKRREERCWVILSHDQDWLDIADQVVDLSAHSN